MSGQDALLNASASNASGLTFQWSPPMFVDNPAKLQPLARPLSTTTFTLTAVSDKGCSNSSSVLVTVLFQPEIPNTFTPNGDGANDRWEIKNLESYPNAVVEVYNTAGQLVFKNTGFYTPWDGTRNGTKLPVGTYYYVIHTRFNNVKRSGYITLLR
jgi:gliding motility-associated-like protein